MTTQRLILASGSSARRELMQYAGYDFEVMPADVDEPTGEGVTDIRQFVQQVSWMKAAAVAPKIDAGVIIAADSVGWINGQVIGKPVDEEDARRILKELSGTTHQLWTGVTLWRRPDDVQIIWQEASDVRFEGMTDADITNYLKTRTWRGCSGAYAVQEQDDPFVRVAAGSISNVIGLPMESLASGLKMIFDFTNEHGSR